MGDDLNLDMSGMKISFHGQELKAIKEITIPPDVELSGDLSSGHINAFPDEVYGKMKFKPKPIAGQHGQDKTTVYRTLPHHETGRKL